MDSPIIGDRQRRGLASIIMGRSGSLRLIPLSWLRNGRFPNAGRAYAAPHFHPVGLLRNAAGIFPTTFGLRSGHSVSR